MNNISPPQRVFLILVSISVALAGIFQAVEEGIHGFSWLFPFVVSAISLYFAMNGTKWKRPDKFYKSKKHNVLFIFIIFSIGLSLYLVSFYSTIEYALFTKSPDISRCGELYIERNKCQAFNDTEGKVSPIIGKTNSGSFDPNSPELNEYFDKYDSQCRCYLDLSYINAKKTDYEDAPIYFILLIIFTLLSFYIYLSIFWLLSGFYVPHAPARAEDDT